MEPIITINEYPIGRDDNCYYNAIKRWESNHKETEILHQLEISNLLEQLKNN